MEKVIVYGRLPVLEYIKSELFSNESKLLIQSSIKKSQINDIIAVAKKKKIPIQETDKKAIQKFSHNENTQGVVLTNVFSFRKISSDAYENLANNRSVIVLFDQLTDPHNTGAIIRSAEALGASCAVITTSHQSPITSVTIKSSAGATAHLPIHTVSNLSNEIDRLKKRGFWIAGSSDHGEDNPSRLYDLRPLAIVIGSEGQGMRKLTESKCDFIFNIPLQGKISSLNASVAAGILLYESLKHH
jgi:23S rRNA (guanosine2251-2'-O)-methyltransferase